MITYFFDTPAIVKCYAPAEQGHTWMVNLCKPTQDCRLYISQAALVEVVAAMCRKARERGITISDLARLITGFRRDVQNDYDLWLVTTAIYTSAGNLWRSHTLHAYGAIQLACVLGLRDKAPAHQAPPPIFVCADDGLITIATTEGLTVENPNNYP